MPCKAGARRACKAGARRACQAGFIISILRIPLMRGIAGALPWTRACA